MDFFNRIKTTFAGGGNATPILWLYVQCERCGTPVAVRVNLYNDPSVDDEGGYILRKAVMDNKCYRLMEAELHLDAGRHIKQQTIQGGKFISKQEYERLAGKPQPS